MSDAVQTEFGRAGAPAHPGAQGRLPPQVRQSRIVAAVQAAGFVAVADIAADLSVSDMTIRRDLIELEREGLVERTHGGAIAAEGAAGHPVDQVEPEFEARLRRNRDTKERIARAALALMEGQRTVALDVGTTTFLLARHLAGQPGIRVFTNSLRIAGVLGAGRGEVYIAGGQIRGDEMTVCGPMAVAEFEQLWFDIAFLGVSGITEDGLFDYSMDDSEMKRAYVRRATRKVLLCDSSKFQRMSLVRIAALADIDVMITDAPPPAGLAAALAAAKVGILVADRAKA
ncbi:MAG: DeoR/GlpR transcriptional regulator [Rhizobiaceae bacterium]|nr:MAG: DeoR/GlpR transcriptional regulator [Rhizobiaceae bacterium]